MGREGTGRGERGDGWFGLERLGERAWLGRLELEGLVPRVFFCWVERGGGEKLQSYKDVD